MLKFKALFQASPRIVADFLVQPFAGIPRDVARKDDFFSVALSANAGRVVIRQWIRVTLEAALLNFKEWFEHLNVVSLSEGSAQRRVVCGSRSTGGCRLVSFRTQRRRGSGSVISRGS